MPHSPPKREANLRLALHLVSLYQHRPPPPDPVLQTADLVLGRLHRLVKLDGLRRHCVHRRWPHALTVVRGRIASELRELQYALGSMQYAPAIVSPVMPTLPAVYRDLVALDEEFGSLEVDEGLGHVAVVTEPVVLEGVALGRFRLVVDLSRLARGRCDGEAVSAEALDPNPAACNEEVTHPHVQAG